MDKAEEMKGTVEPAAVKKSDSSDALWDELLAQVTPTDQSQTTAESLNQIIEDLVIKDPRQQREFRRKTEQQGQGQ